MEQIQKIQLDQLRLSLLDNRLRSIRETALGFYNRATVLAVERGIRLTDSTMLGIYRVCLQQALSIAGITISSDLLTDDSPLGELVREVSR
ncbi:MAG: hypothetical protein AB1427_12105 [Thermodesulfobacteriota bacterium]